MIAIIIIHIIFITKPSFMVVPHQYIFVTDKSLHFYSFVNTTLKLCIMIKIKNIILRILYSDTLEINLFTHTETGT